MTAAKPFDGQVDRSGGPDACWPWKGSRPGRYGQYTRNHHRFLAHRRALALALGRELTPNELALHHCDNPPCCNPAHLYVGTQIDNIADMVRRGRHRSNPNRGEASGRAKLTEQQVRSIHAALVAGRTRQAIGSEMGVSPHTVWDIAKGRKWKHLGLSLVPSSRKAVA